MSATKYQMRVELLVEVEAESEAEAIGQLDRLRSAGGYTTTEFVVNPCRGSYEIPTIEAVNGNSLSEHEGEERLRVARRLVNGR